MASSDQGDQADTIRPQPFSPDEDVLTEPPKASADPAIEALGGAKVVVPAGTPAEPIEPDGDTRADPVPFAGLLAEAQSGDPEKSEEEPSKAPPPQDPASQAPTTMRIRPDSDVIVQQRVSADTLPGPKTAERIVGPYRILEELGSGGMAVVHKAIQPALDRLVALKELRSEYVHDKQISTRFEREATSLATLQHGNIVHVYDYLREVDSAYIVMEYVDGIDLFDVLADAPRVPADIAAIVASQVAAGLEYAHSRGIVHRDIKPSNILLSKRGEVKIMDFGIARDPGKSELTQIGLAVGTPAYMAPEQIRGDTIDFRTDIFALGICLYEMLAGEKPWPEEEGRSVTVKVLDEPYIPIDRVHKGVPPALVRIIERCLAKDPAERFATTFELRRALEIYVSTEVPADPRARIALFLRNRGYITDGDATDFVDETLLNDAGIRRRDEGLTLPPADVLLRPIGIAHAIALAVILAAAVLAVFAPIGRSLEANAALPSAGDRAPTPAELEKLVDARVAEVLKQHAKSQRRSGGEPGAPRLGALAEAASPTAMTGEEGFVQVIVKPWARIFVDGKFFDYTPVARPVALPPGRHRIGLRNPYYESVDRYVEVSTGQTQTLKVTLIPKDQPGEEP